MRVREGESEEGEEDEESNGLGGRHFKCCEVW